ncbi:hypothetical protein Hanom_Chr08g00745481 [Helianthus anomalus]
MGVLGEFKRGVDVAHGDWFGVREGTHLLGVHPLHPNKSILFKKFFSSKIISIKYVLVANVGLAHLV